MSVKSKRLVLAASLMLALAGLAGCGDDAGQGQSRAASTEPLVVSAAASLQKAFTTYGATAQGGNARFSFAGSDALAAQIRAGARPDVFAAANTKLPDALYAAGLVERPTVFAGNRLVLAVPAQGAKVTSLAGAGADGVKLAIGSDSVPIGSYTRKVVARLPEREAAAILGNVRSDEPDVKGIVGKLTQGAVDAGFVYITDVRAASGALKAIELPASVKPSAAYGAAVVKGSEQEAAARAFIAGLVDGEGATALEVAGFEPPPR